MEYTSSTTFAGLPLVHIKTGRVVDGQFQRGIARGWMALGDYSAVGGVAVGLNHVEGAVRVALLTEEPTAARAESAPVP